MDAKTTYWVIYYVTIVNNEFKGLSLYPQKYKRRGNAVLTAQKMFDGNKDAMGVISDAVAFGRCARCQNPTRELKYNIHVLKGLLGLKDDATTVEYAGDGNTTWRTETKENKND